MKNVLVEGLGIIEFPDNMQDAEIGNAINQHFESIKSSAAHLLPPEPEQGPQFPEIKSEVMQAGGEWGIPKQPEPLPRTNINMMTLVPPADKTKTRGMIEPGNINLNNRPVVKNEDGSISTVDSISGNFDGVEVLIPRVSEDGRHLSTPEAVEEYKRTGKHLGKFTSPEAATSYAQQLHLDQQEQYVTRPKPLDIPPLKSLKSSAAHLLPPEQEQGPQFPEIKSEVMQAGGEWGIPKQPEPEPEPQPRQPEMRSMEPVTAHTLTQQAPDKFPQAQEQAQAEWEAQRNIDFSEAERTRVGKLAPFVNAPSVMRRIVKGKAEGPQFQPEGIIESTASSVGGIAADLPLYMVGGAVGGAAGKLAAAAGTFALPGAIREGQGAYDEGKSATEIGIAAAKGGLKEGLVGLAMGASGSIATALGAGNISKLATEVISLTTASAAMEGRLPDLNEFEHNALLLLALKGANRGTIESVINKIHEQKPHPSAPTPKNLKEWDAIQEQPPAPGTPENPYPAGTPIQVETPVEATGPKEATYEDFMADQPEDFLEPEQRPAPAIQALRGGVRRTGMENLFPQERTMERPTEQPETQGYPTPPEPEIVEPRASSEAVLRRIDVNQPIGRRPELGTPEVMVNTRPAPAPQARQEEVAPAGKPEAQKQPWEKEDWERKKDSHRYGPDTTSVVQYAQNNGLDLTQEVNKANAKREETQSRLNQLQAMNLRDLKKIATSEGVDVGKELDENPYNTPKAAISFALDHRRQVDKALASNKPVPPEVLAEYPDLQKKYGKQEEKPTERTAAQFTDEEIAAHIAEKTSDIAAKQPWEMVFEDIDSKYPVAGESIEGRSVGKKIDNLDSIDSSLENPTELQGIREIPIKEGPPKFYSVEEELRTRKLADQIQQNGRIDPLIVVDDGEADPYILEGGHRYDALRLLGAKSFPAKVVVDEDAYYTATKNALTTGKPVPPEVLADYPDLAKKYGKPEEKVAAKPAERPAAQFTDEEIAAHIAEKTSDIAAKQQEFRNPDEYQQQSAGQGIYETKAKTEETLTTEQEIEDLYVEQQSILHRQKKAGRWTKEMEAKAREDYRSGNLKKYSTGTGREETAQAMRWDSDTGAKAKAQLERMAGRRIAGGVKVVVGEPHQHPTEAEKTVYGSYDPKTNTIFITPVKGTTIVHEGIHALLETHRVLKEQGAPGIFTEKQERALDRKLGNKGLFKENEEEIAEFAEKIADLTMKSPSKDGTLAAAVAKVKLFLRRTFGFGWKRVIQKAVEGRLAKQFEQRASGEMQPGTGDIRYSSRLDREAKKQGVSPEELERRAAEEKARREGHAYGRQEIPVERGEILKWIKENYPADYKTLNRIKTKLITAKGTTKEATLRKYFKQKKDAVWQKFEKAKLEAQRRGKQNRAAKREQLRQKMLANKERAKFEGVIKRVKVWKGRRKYGLSSENHEVFEPIQDRSATVAHASEMLSRAATIYEQDSIIQAIIDNARTSLEGVDSNTFLRRMPRERLQAINNFMRAILHQNRMVNEQLHAADKATFNDAVKGADQSIVDNFNEGHRKKVNEGSTQIADNASWVTRNLRENMDHSAVVQLFFGKSDISKIFNENIYNKLKEVYGRIHALHDNFFKFRPDLFKNRRDLAEYSPYLSPWDRTKLPKHEVTLESGAKLQLTKGDLVGFYGQWGDYNTRALMLKDGFGGLSFEGPSGYTLTQMTPKDYEAILATAKKAGVEPVAKWLQKQYNNQDPDGFSKRANDFYEKWYGTPLFKERTDGSQYSPRVSAEGDPFESVMDMKRFTKGLLPNSFKDRSAHKHGILITDPFRLFAHHVAQVETFINMYPELNLALKVLNDGHVKARMNQVYKSGDQIIKQIQNGIFSTAGLMDVHTQTATDRMAKGILAALPHIYLSLRSNVMLYQPLSLLKAIGYVKPRHWAGLDSLNIFKNIREMNGRPMLRAHIESKHFGMGEGRRGINLRQFFGTETIGLKEHINLLARWGMDIFPLLDHVSLSLFYSAKKREARALGIKDVKEWALDETEQWLREAWPTTNPLNLSEKQREWNEHPIKKLAFGMFVSEPMKNYSLFVRKLDDWRHGRINTYRMAQHVGVQLSITMMVSAIQQAMFGKNDDDAKGIAEGYVTRLIFNQLGMFPLLADALKAFYTGVAQTNLRKAMGLKGNYSNRGMNPGFISSNIDNVIRATKKTIKFIGDDQKQLNDFFDGVLTLIGTASNFAGIHVPVGAIQQYSDWALPDEKKPAAAPLPAGFREITGQGGSNNEYTGGGAFNQ